MQPRATAALAHWPGPSFVPGPKRRHLSLDGYVPPRAEPTPRAAPLLARAAGSSSTWRRRSRFALVLLVLSSLAIWGATLFIGRGRRRLERVLGLDNLATACENPYAEFGRLLVDPNIPEGNRWMPYDVTCAPPPLFAMFREGQPHYEGLHSLAFPIPTKRFRPEMLPLPWAANRTILLVGDHVERLHVKDFCTFAAGEYAVIGSNHTLSPVPFLNGIDEKLWRGGEATASRPAVCFVARYDLMLISVSHYGLANRVEFDQESDNNLYASPFFYPPVSLRDRLSHIVLPLFDALNRPPPDLIEFSSSFWDLRHMHSQDERTGARQDGDLSLERLQWYSDRLTKSLVHLSSTFPGTPLLWRAVHHTPSCPFTPFYRLAALDQLGRQVIKDLNRSQRDGKNIKLIFPPLVGASTRKSTKRRKSNSQERESTHAPFLELVRGRINGPSTKPARLRTKAGPELVRGEIRIDEWGTIMLGQTFAENAVYTPALPGGFVWGDILLFELRRIAMEELSNSHIF